MKRTFELEWEDELGPFWMNKDNLLLCINSYCGWEPCKVKDVTEEIIHVSADIEDIRAMVTGDPNHKSYVSKSYIVKGEEEK